MKWAFTKTEQLMKIAVEPIVYALWAKTELLCDMLMGRNILIDEWRQIGIYKSIHAFV